MELYATPSLAILAEDVDTVVKKHHPNASPLARAYIIGVLEQNVRAEAFSHENPSSPRKGFLTLVEMRQRCIERPYQFKDLGDHCLLWYGFFYERTERRGFADYTSCVGAAAYQQYGSLFHLGGSSDSLFDELSADFRQWGNVLGVLFARSLPDDQLIATMERQAEKPTDRYALILEERGLPDLTKTPTFS